MSDATALPPIIPNCVRCGAVNHTTAGHDAARLPARVHRAVTAAIGSVDRLRCCPDMKHGCAGHHHPITPDTRESLASLITATVVEALDAT